MEENNYPLNDEVLKVHENLINNLNSDIDSEEEPEVTAAKNLYNLYKKEKIQFNRELLERLNKTNIKTFNILCKVYYILDSIFREEMEFTTVNNLDKILDGYKEFRVFMKDLHTLRSQKEYLTEKPNKLDKALKFGSYKGIELLVDNIYRINKIFELNMLSQIEFDTFMEMRTIALQKLEYFVNKLKKDYLYLLDKKSDESQETNS